MEAVYKTKATSVGGRDGHVSTDDGILNLDLGRPGVKGRDGRTETNPEQLFAAGYAACFNSALSHIARAQGIKTGTVEVAVEISLVNDTDGGFALEAALDVLVPDVDEKTANELAEAAHNFCPYAKATRGNIKTTVTARNR